MTILKKKSMGFAFVALAGVMGIVGSMLYAFWAIPRNALNPMVLGGLVAAIILDIILVFYDSEYVIVASTGCFGIALFQLLSDSVGSFVDAYQGIVMFGDSSQIGTIVLISAFIAVGALGSIIASFMRRAKAR